MSFPQALYAARSCYGHFAGRYALAIIDAMRANRFLALRADEGFRLTRKGIRWVMTWHPHADEPFLLTARGKPCMDRTERRPHIGGDLGRVLLDGWIAAGWLARTELARQVVLTAMGRRRFQSAIQIPPAANELRVRDTRSSRGQSECRRHYAAQSRREK